MKQQGFLIGESWTLCGTAVFAAVLSRHFDRLPLIALKEQSPKAKSEKTLANEL